MLELFISAIKINFADNTWNALAFCFTVIAKTYMKTTEVIQWAGALMAGFALKEICFNSKNPFFWRRFKENPILTIEKLKEEELLKFFFKAIASWVTVGLVIFIVLAMLAIFEPQDGLHVRDQMTNANVARAIGLCSVLTLYTIMIRVFIYRSVGFIKSVGEFKLRMILW